MRLVRYSHKDRIGYGIYSADCVQPVAWAPYDGAVESREKLAADDITLLAPVEPTKIIGIGLNYRDHANELKMKVADEPTIFLKAPSAVIGPGGVIRYPGRSRKVDYEAELAVVIGKETRDVSALDALSFVLGYTCAMDITARDLQASDGQWTRAKNFDTFCPLGPWVETELEPGGLDISLSVNDVLAQESNTSEMIVGVPELIAFVSNVMTLCPGDVILTGTPAGVGALERGDRVEMAIEGIGKLSCTVEENA
ncbi:MAG: hypothetical protein CVT63_02490 [Candidatus Anoxymicrobium japonicum]|uniref:2-hydroxyhepta-2,4-diene-1,7-dioate isomerase n=1 Tax=Candidatus Anoxymicrobium japonicum TaxID=2013648 RepID=A0A2N3G704_9ACTN|nr:MAG: hypothetical protein CVT63_02490 [Candidatus Anoxymicrobium japonicum]